MVKPICSYCYLSSMHKQLLKFHAGIESPIHFMFFLKMKNPTANKNQQLHTIVMAFGYRLVIFYLCLVFSLFSLTTVSLSTDNQLGRQYTGVAFTPYVKNAFENGSFPNKNSYTMQEIEVMLEVISTKFSHILTFGRASPNATYVWNDTYYQSNLNVYISEAAAKFNKKYNTTRVTVFQTIYVHEEDPYSGTEMMLAVECMEKANNIFPGTVEGLVISGDDFIINLDKAEVALNMLMFLRKKVVGHGSYTVGTRFYCECALERQLQMEKENKLWEVYNLILENSDFLICQFDEFTRARFDSPNETFYSIMDSITRYNETMLLGKKLDLKAEVRWASDGDEFFSTVQNMQVFWETAIAWAGRHKVFIYFFEAFDEPYARYSHMGWWKLIDNSTAGDISGYVEKMNVSDRPIDGGTNNTTIVVISVVILGVFFSLIILLLVRMRILQRKLSKEDIRKFVEGASNIDDIHIDDKSSRTSISAPYDYSYELVIHQLQIDYNKVLGTGQFGCVYNATIRRYNSGYIEEVEVALKVAKNECSQIALKGLLYEIKILIHIGRHPNIVELVGAYTAELNKGIVYIALELCSLGSLEDYLRKLVKTPGWGHTYENIPKEAFNAAYVDTSETVSFQEMIRWSHGIASGMEFLGTKNVVHADLAIRNVLLTEDKIAKISDFGLSRRMYEFANYKKTGTGPSPWRWMAIESLKRCEFSTKSDVWSYGVALWEIFTIGDVPYPGLAYNVEFVNMLVDGMRLGRPPVSTAALYAIMEQCWKTEPEDRPSFTQIKNAIENLIVECSD